MRSTERTDERILVSDIFERDSQRAPRPAHGEWTEPGRKIPVYHRCDVLVVGGGPSGTAAAAAAAAQGADVTLLERYNHLGGLSTGGLVLWIDRMTDWEGKLVIRGFAEELFDRSALGATMGLYSSVLLLAGSIGPVAAGVIAERSGERRWVSLIVVGAASLAAAATWLMDYGRDDE